MYGVVDFCNIVDENYILFTGTYAECEEYIHDNSYPDHGLQTVFLEDEEGHTHSFNEWGVCSECGEIKYGSYAYLQIYGGE